jgi:glycosyltransferase involved in cell wall biosynthesis
MLTLVVVHNHFRPGGVRRVIETALPHIVTHCTPAINRVLLVSGEAPEPGWFGNLKNTLDNCEADYKIHTSLSYHSELNTLSRKSQTRMLDFFHSIFTEPNDFIVWLHNPGLGRNLRMVQILQKACSQMGAPLLMHHHDWWFDNRWDRWSKLRQTGFSSLAAVAKVVFAHSPLFRHVMISSMDASMVKAHLGDQAAWIPNHAEPSPAVSLKRKKSAQQWLQTKLGDKSPVWLMPCRLLRRKNIAEALLLTRWLRPDAWLATTADASSADEAHYAHALRVAIAQHKWKAKLGILHGEPAGSPSIDELMAASEAVIFTSIQEGFGLPYVETAAAGRPLIARSLPNIAPDLAHWGFVFPQYYQELIIPTGCFDWNKERAHQLSLFDDWRKKLPVSIRSITEIPSWLSTSEPINTIPFSRLTLPAQIEVLAQPVDQSWACCIPHNPFLLSWRAMAQRKRLETTIWPQQATQELGGMAYANRFREILNRSISSCISKSASANCQQAFIKAKFDAQFSYPLLWSTLVK